MTHCQGLTWHAVRDWCDTLSETGMTRCQTLTWQARVETGAKYESCSFSRPLCPARVLVFMEGVMDGSSQKSRVSTFSPRHTPSCNTNPVICIHKFTWPFKNSSRRKVVRMNWLFSWWHRTQGSFLSCQSWIKWSSLAERFLASLVCRFVHSYNGGFPKNIWYFIFTCV